MRSQMRDYLAADATLTGLLSGGIHTAMEISRQETPGAFDANSEVLPCILVRLETTTPAGVHAEAARIFVRLFFYQQRGTDRIDAAMARCFALLDRQRLDGCWEIQHADDLYDLHDPGLNCSLAVSRYMAIARR